MFHFNKKRAAVFLLTAVIALVSCGCEGQSAEQNDEEADALSFTDDLDRTVSVNKNHGVLKAAACLGSLADIWHLAGGKVIGATEDGFNEDRRYDANYGVNLGSNKAPNVELIISMKPDLVLLSSNLQGHRKIMSVLENSGISTAYFSVETFDDYLRMLKICTDITGCFDNYKKYGTDVEEKIKDVVSESEDKDKPEVLLLRATSKDIKAKNSKNMVGAMLKDLGCINIADNDDTMLENLSLEAIIERNPDFIFVIPMGEEEEAERTVDRQLKKNDAWNNLDAVKNGRFIILEKEYFHYKPNEKWCDSYEILSEILYGR